MHVCACRLRDAGTVRRLESVGQGSSGASPVCGLLASTRGKSGRQTLAGRLLLRGYPRPRGRRRKTEAEKARGWPSGPHQEGRGGLAEIDRTTGLENRHADVLAALRIRIEGGPAQDARGADGRSGDIKGKRARGARRQASRPRETQAEEATWATCSNASRRRADVLGRSARRLNDWLIAGWVARQAIVACRITQITRSSSRSSARARSLERAGQLQQHVVVVAPSDDLQPDRESFCVEAARHGHGRVQRDVERIRERDRVHRLDLRAVDARRHRAFAHANAVVDVVGVRMMSTSSKTSDEDHVVLVTPLDRARELIAREASLGDLRRRRGSAGVKSSARSGQ